MEEKTVLKRVLQKARKVVEQQEVFLVLPLHRALGRKGARHLEYHPKRLRTHVGRAFRLCRHMQYLGQQHDRRRTSGQGSFSDQAYHEGNYARAILTYEALLKKIMLPLLNLALKVLMIEFLK